MILSYLIRKDLFSVKKGRDYMKEIKRSSELEKMLDYACKIEGAEGVLTAAGFLVAVIDAVTGVLHCEGAELKDYLYAFFPETKTDIIKVKELLIESIRSPQKLNIYTDAKKHNEVFIKTVMADAELMAEKAGRELMISKDLYLSIILRPDGIIKSCFDRAQIK